jgi:glycosyltransferase involved in cell wall biosynthesis
MKIIQVPFCFYPDAVGGTEVYVAALSRHLQDLGLEVMIAAPGAVRPSYRHDGVPVRRFSVSADILDLRTLYGEGDTLAQEQFARVLDAERPDVVHLHAFAAGVSLRLVREATGRGIAVAFTYHTPTVTCQRGTLMRWGTDACDGALDLHTCARCTLHGLGLNRPASLALGSLPPIVGRMVAALGLSGDIATALRMTELIKLRHSTVRSLLTEVGTIVVLCQWARDLLLRNGVSPKKITVSPHGLPHGGTNVADKADRTPLADGPLRIAFFGRVDPVKGPDILVRAIRLLPGAYIRLDLYGVVQGAPATAYLTRLQALAANDPRIAFLPSVSSDRIVPLLRKYHVLAVPSRCLETGPLVALEAFAAGIPVVGSDLGGLAELVHHGINGLLVESGSLQGWSEALWRLSEDRPLLTKLHSGVRPPRQMTDVAIEMRALYAGLVA